MTQEQKDLLLKDLCARLPYNVKIKIKTYEDIDEIDSIGTLCQLNKQYFWILEDEYERCIEYNKPYLFPLSSMTDEQFAELKAFADLTYEGNTLELVEWNDNYKTLEFWLEEIPSYCVIKVFDWLNKNHFDYRGLIDEGLVDDATGLNIY